MKECLSKRKSKGSSEVSRYVQSRPDSLGYYTDSWPYTVPLRTGPWQPVALVVGQLVLQWGNTQTIICECRGLNHRMHKQ